MINMLCWALVSICGLYIMGAVVATIKIRKSPLSVSVGLTQRAKKLADRTGKIVVIKQK